MRNIKETAIADILDQQGGFKEYEINYDTRMVSIVTIAGERISLSFGEVIKLYNERKKRRQVH